MARKKSTGRSAREPRKLFMNPITLSTRKRAKKKRRNTGHLRLALGVKPLQKTRYARLERQQFLSALAPQHGLIGLDATQDAATGQALADLVDARALRISQQYPGQTVGNDETGLQGQRFSAWQQFGASRQAEHRCKRCCIESRTWCGGD